MKLENVVIVAQSKNWYCKRCKRTHEELYIKNKEFKYCDQCVPEELKRIAIKINQNRERI